ncbi:uncharacterized protein LOC121412485 [Lytechinus variegatus]|uniref:uncharacterized protein LOC121412485 n=1 Tax=Lytechinus variegatus TaxID=7654 RepID=UPI001BB20FEC|nr:uncharacterized protein LOC121412485 [Lytechinus variegatus]
MSEMFTLFWESVYRSYFTGIRQLSPRISLSNNLLSDTWQVIGRIFSHGYVLSNFIPTQITYSTLYYLFMGNEPATREYESSFLNTLSKRNETLLNRAMRSNPSVPRFQEPFQSNLVAILSHYGATALPIPRSINTIISQIARYHLHLQPFYASHNIRTGTLRSHDSIWNPCPSNYSIFHLFHLFHPTPDNVIDHFDVEYSNWRLSPRISPSNDLLSDTWQVIGRILSHGYVLSNLIPTQITYSTLYYLFMGNEPTTREYMSSFLNTLSERNETLLNRAMR